LSGLANGRVLGNCWLLGSLLVTTVMHDTVTVWCHLLCSRAHCCSSPGRCPHREPCVQGRLSQAPAAPGCPVQRALSLGVSGGWTANGRLSRGDLGAFPPSPGKTLGPTLGLGAPGSRPLSAPRGRRAQGSCSEDAPAHFPSGSSAAPVAEQAGRGLPPDHGPATDSGHTSGGLSLLGGEWRWWSPCPPSEGTQGEQ